MIKVGVTAFQGDVEEHIITVERAMDSMGIEGRAIPIRKKMVDVDALIIPGGESTTISSLMIKTGIFEEIKKIADDIPIMGTCAGCILMSKEVDHAVKTLELMDMEVERNAFGRQKDSFQCS
ncbi:MAG: pyridoxal 5'-phosphate synthase glutaminase subunit PdxT, partial [Thermoplasmata archaeon]